MFTLLKVFLMSTIFDSLKKIFSSDNGNSSDFDTSSVSGHSGGTGRQLAGATRSTEMQQRTGAAPGAVQNKKRKKRAKAPTLMPGGGGHVVPLRQLLNNMVGSGSIKGYDPRRG